MINVLPCYVSFTLPLLHLHSVLTEICDFIYEQYVKIAELKPGFEHVKGRNRFVPRTLEVALSELGIVLLVLA